jgi:hypothetical protein
MHDLVGEIVDAAQPDPAKSGGRRISRKSVELHLGGKAPGSEKGVLLLPGIKPAELPESERQKNCRGCNRYDR